MNTWILLHRGVNVGGGNRILMKDLRTALAGNGFGNVRTYIQSGNVVMDAAPSWDRVALVNKTRGIINDGFGFNPEVLVLAPAELETAISANPFPEPDFAVNRVHFFYLAETVDIPDRDGLETLRSDDESFSLVGKVFYLSAPSGMGRSKLAAKLQQFIPTTMTARNHRTVLAIRDLI